MRSPPLTYSITKYTRVSVWKHECRPNKNGCRSRAAAKKTRFSERVLDKGQISWVRFESKCSLPLNFVIVNDELLLQHLDGIQPVAFLLFGQHDFTKVSFT